MNLVSFQTTILSVTPLFHFISFFSQISANKLWDSLIRISQSAGAVEYSDCTSAEG